MFKGVLILESSGYIELLLGEELAGFFFLEYLGYKESLSLRLRIPLYVFMNVPALDVDSRLLFILFLFDFFLDILDLPVDFTPVLDVLLTTFLAFFAVTT